MLVEKGLVGEYSTASGKGRECVYLQVWLRILDCYSKSSLSFSILPIPGFPFQVSRLRNDTTLVKGGPDSGRRFCKNISKHLSPLLGLFAGQELFCFWTGDIFLLAGAVGPRAVIIDIELLPIGDRRAVGVFLGLLVIGKVHDE